MGLCIPTYSKPIKYVPDVFGNRALKEPFWTEIEPCSAIEYDAMGSNGDLSPALIRDLIKARVKQISGLVLARDDGQKFTPTTGEALMAVLEQSRIDNPSRNALTTDLAVAVLNHSRLKEGELDRFVSQSE